jgi:hypothetical protein
MMLVLHNHFNFNDDELEFQENGKSSFKDFIGLGVMNNIHAATTSTFSVSAPQSRSGRGVIQDV